MVQCSHGSFSLPCRGGGGSPLAASQPLVNSSKPSLGVTGRGWGEDQSWGEEEGREGQRMRFIWSLKKSVSWMMLCAKGSSQYDSETPPHVPGFHLCPQRKPKGFFKAHGPPHPVNPLDRGQHAFQPRTPVSRQKP